MGVKTAKCQICGEPYIFYPFKVGDQSACPKCIEKARKNQPSWKRP